MQRIIAGLAAVLIPAGVLAAGAVQKTIEQVYAEKEALKGREVTVSGKVTRVTNDVMERNFLHIEDGTGGEGSNDLTVTSRQTAQIGDRITATGTLGVGRDFGAGYSYPAILEQATISKVAQ
jgi:hypothetical protein